MNDSKNNERAAGLRTGVIFAGAWSLVLLVAFLIHPEPDNLIVGYVVFALSGVDALESLSVAGAVGVGMAQVMASFGIGYLVGRYKG